MDFVEVSVMGKQKTEKVPVLLKPAMKVGIDILNSTRDVCGVSSGNIYAFAKGDDNYISGSEALNHVLKKIPGLKHLELIRFPKMRKYLATVVQLFGIKETELQEVARRHMGHELSVHRENYRLQDDVIELAKISKLLLAVESGKAYQFSGVSLDDIELDAIPEVDDCACEIAQLQPNNEIGNEIAISEFDDCVTVPSANLQPDKEIAEEDIADLNIEDMVASSEQKPRNEGPKKKWSAKERSELSPLVTKSMVTKMPPKDAEVQKLQALSNILKSMKWIRI